MSDPVLANEWLATSAFKLIRKQGWRHASARRMATNFSVNVIFYGYDYARLVRGRGKPFKDEKTADVAIWRKLPYRNGLPRARRFPLSPPTGPRLDSRIPYLREHSRPPKNLS